MKRLAFAGWCGFLAVSLVGLHLVGSGELAMPWRPDTWSAWVGEVGAGIAIVAVVRVVAVALAWYLVVATLVGAAASVGRGRIAAAVEAAIPRFLRRLIVSAHGLAISTGGLVVATAPVVAGVGGPASAEPLAVEATAELRQVDPSAQTAGAEPLAVEATAVLRQVDPSPGEAPASEPVATPTAGDEGTATLSVVELDWAGFDPDPWREVPTAPAEPDTWVVACGDHFWSIAAEIVAEASPEPPSAAEIDAYWRSLIDANRDRLVAPGNPDLLLPGQTLVLPAVEG